MKLNNFEINKFSFPIELIMLMTRVWLLIYNGGLLWCCILRGEGKIQIFIISTISIHILFIIIIAHKFKNV